MTDDRPGRELITLDDGREVWQYPSGVLKDPETGHLLRGPDHAIIQDSSQAIAMASARWEAYRTSAELGAAIGARRDTSLDAYQWMVERQTELAGDISKGRASTEAFRAVSQALGTTPDRSAAAQSGNLGGVSIHIDAGVAQKLVEMFMEQHENDKK